MVSIVSALSALPLLGGPAKTLPRGPYQPLGVELIPDALQYLDLPVGGEMIGPVLMVVSLLLAWLLRLVGPRLIKLLLGPAFLSVARRAFSWLAGAVILSGAYWGWGFAQDGARRALAACEPAYIVAITTCLTFSAMAWATLLVEWWLRGRENSGQAALIARRTAGLFIVCAATISVMRHFGYDIWTLVTALGVGSLAIGLAAKDTIANTISGVVLMFDQPFRVGDRIKIGASGSSSGMVGEVVEVGLRSTRIRLLDKTILVIPNTELCNSHVVNITVSGSIGGKIELLLEPLSCAGIESLLPKLAAAVPPLLSIEPDDVKVFVVGSIDACLRINILFPMATEGILEQYDTVNRALMQLLENEGAVPYDSRQLQRALS